MIPALPSGLSRPVGHVVHVGAGGGKDLPMWQALQPQAVILIEADPKHMPALEKLAREDIRIIGAAVTTDPTQTEIGRASFPELSSLRVPTGALELFPGLRVTARIPVIPLDPADLIRGLELDPQACNLLVLEAPGESLDILACLKSANLLDLFSVICLQAGRTELFAGAGTCAAIAELLQAAGFQVREMSLSSDPDRPYLEAFLGRGEPHLQRALAVLPAEKVAIEAPAADRLEKLKADLQAEIRLKVAAQKDLVDLKAQYADLLDAKVCQDALLMAVTQKLTVLSGELTDPSKKVAGTRRTAKPENRKMAAKKGPSS